MKRTGQGRQKAKNHASPLSCFFFSFCESETTGKTEKLNERKTVWDIWLSQSAASTEPKEMPSAGKLRRISELSSTIAIWWIRLLKKSELKDIMNRVEEGGTIAGKGAEGDVRGSFSKYADLTERAIHVQKQIIRKLAEKRGLRHHRTIRGLHLKGQQRYQASSGLLSMHRMRSAFRIS